MGASNTAFTNQGGGYRNIQSFFDELYARSPGIQITIRSRDVTHAPVTTRGLRNPKRFRDLRESSVTNAKLLCKPLRRNRGICRMRKITKTIMQTVGRNRCRLKLIWREFGWELQTGTAIV